MRSLFHAPRGGRKAELRAIDGGTEPQLFLYDEIGWPFVTAADVVAALGQVRGGTLHVRLNSPGGDVLEGVAIFNALRRHPATIVVHVDAIAASIASLIMLAGDEVLMAETSFVMIHNASGITFGTAEEHRQMAETLDKVNDSALVDNYKRATGQEEAQVRAWMDAEQWFSAEEAVALGFADAIDPASTEMIEADFDLSVFRNPPTELAAKTGRRRPAPRDLERALRDVGLSATAAKAVLSGGLKLLKTGDDDDLDSRDASAVVPDLRQLIRAIG